MGNRRAAKRLEEEDSIFNGKVHRVTVEDTKLPWNGHHKNFRCYLCGHTFAVGDLCRWVFSGVAGNPLVCSACDGTDAEVIEKWKAHRATAYAKYWWFCR